ncbi:MAG: hypothetical protein KF779_07925 [Hyphomonadaceae bacterium]|nr:hypothetical protein [Hyphomonadaceae bacterium]
MRTLIRGALIGLVLSATALSACQRQAPSSEEGPSTPSNAEREAQIAAETLAALGGPASAEQRAAYEGEFQASGGIDALGSGEGAWELTLLDDYAQFTRPGLGEDGGIPGERDYREHGMRVVAGQLTITISQQACTASGVELPYTASILFEGVPYQGCARRGVTEGERPTWASVLPELMPAINVCTERATSRPARVTFASPLDEGEMLVRVREANGSRRECIVTAGEVSVYEPLADSDRRNGEGDPEFQPGGSRPAARNCRTVEAAVDRTGTQLGWLIRESC